jgi:hypothetical protein
MVCTPDPQNKIVLFLGNSCLGRISNPTDQLDFQVPVMKVEDSGAMATPVNFFTTTVGQAAQIHGQSLPFESINHLLKSQADLIGDLPCIGFPFVSTDSEESGFILCKKLSRRLELLELTFTL